MIIMNLNVLVRLNIFNKKTNIQLSKFTWIYKTLVNYYVWMSSGGQEKI